jgi:hypothetical protein
MTADLKNKVFAKHIDHFQSLDMLTPINELWNNTWKYDNFDRNCHNPSLRLTIKAKACKVTGQKEVQESHRMLIGV